jgi:hypothetical protein
MGGVVNERDLGEGEEEVWLIGHSYADRAFDKNPECR